MEMTLLVTGGRGFVMINVVRHWLERHPDDHAIVVDAAPTDAATERFMAPVQDRIMGLTADLTDGSDWRSLIPKTRITHVIHGATITPHPFVDETGRSYQPEFENPRRVLDVNIMGTVNVLEWARTLGSLHRFVYVSSGSVYNDRPSEPSDSAISEEGDVNPRGLYGISKYCCEMICRRYADLFGFPAVSARLSGVFGPMDRRMPSRGFQSMPYVIAHRAWQGRRVSVSALEGVCDVIHVGDVAEAMARLLTTRILCHDTYNVSSGRATSVGELITYANERVEGFDYEIVSEDEAEIVRDPTKRTGYWGAYDNSRLRAELDWQPRSARQGMHDYIDWLKDNAIP